jgi:hypothetical protein
MSEPTGGLQDLPLETAARLRAAEDRLFPLALVDVERYQRGTTLCGLLLDDLRAHCHDLPATLRRRPVLLERLPDLAVMAGLTLEGLQAETLVDASLALRCREIQNRHQP